MGDRYDDYFKSFYIKQYDYWKEVYKKTKNKAALERAQELKEFIYRKWLIELDPIKANEEGFARTTLQIKYAELEKENIKLLDKLNLQNQRLNELKKENAELKEDLMMFQFLDEQNKKEIENLKAQIEKLK